MHAIPTNFWQWISSLDSDDLVGFMIISVLALVSIVVVVAVTIHQVHKNRLNYALKRELLDRGMSADEIATIVSAEPTKGGLRGVLRGTRT